MKKQYVWRIVISVFFFMGLSLLSFGGAKNDPFQIGDMKVAAGELKSGYLKVPDKDGDGSFIPVTIINGIKEGKT